MPKVRWLTFVIPMAATIWQRFATTPNFAVGKRFTLQVTLDSSTETGVQLFYMMLGDKAYNEEHSAMYPLKKGKNVIYFKVDQDVVDSLRLDPSFTPGEYTIESIIARSIP